MQDHRPIRGWRWLARRVRVWSDKPEPDDLELAVLAPGALFILAIANLRQVLRRVFSRLDRARRPAMSGVVIPGPDGKRTPMCVVGRRRWWRRSHRGFLLASLHLESPEGGIAVVLPGVVNLVGSDASFSGGVGAGLMFQFSAGDRVELRAAFQPGVMTGSPYRETTLLVARRPLELRVLG